MAKQNPAQDTKADGRETLSHADAVTFTQQYALSLADLPLVRFVDNAGNLLALDSKGRGIYELRMVGE